MRKHPSLPPKTDRKSLSKLEQEFYLQYGKTLAAWAQLEQTLGQLFCALCRFESGSQLGSELFFSGRSFQTRADLLWAALRSVDLPEDVAVVIRLALKRARDYSGARNKVAHGYPSHMVFVDVDWQGWRIKEGEQSHLPGGIGITELKNAQANFSDLQLLSERLVQLTKAHLQKIAWPPRDHLAQAQGLPPDPFLPSQYQSEEERPSPGLG